jgi:tRNA-guanine family transglycosylase
MTGEPLAIRLASMHNLRFYLDLMEKIRKAITYEYFEDMVKYYKEIKD